MTGRTFLRADWRHLLMIHYQVDRQRLARYTPAGTELDEHDGSVFVSLVAFRFLLARVLGVSVPWHRDFDEMNLRFYVRRTVSDQTRHGVVFLREIVPRIAVAAIARLLYNEPYVSREMRSEVDPGPPPAVRYECRTASRWHSIAGQGESAGRVASDDSLEAFLAYRYWGYTRQRDGTTIEYEVRHPPWTIWPVQETTIDADLAAIYGRELAAMLGRPHSAMIADGSTVSLSLPTRI